MSRSLLIKGTFKNGKTRCIGVHNPINCDHNKSKFTVDDVNFLIRVAESGKKSFQWCLENEKFISLKLIVNCSYENSTDERNFSFSIPLFEPIFTSDNSTKKFLPHRLYTSNFETYVEIANNY